MSGWLTETEIHEIGFLSVGKDVLISNTAKFYCASKMVIGSHVRIDDYSVLVGNISIGNHVHIGAFASLHASYGSICIDDFSGLSSRVTIYAASDDFSGNCLIGYGIPDNCRNILFSEIVISKFCHIGTGSTLLPGAKLSEGASMGAMSLLKECTEPWHVYAGIPCKKKYKRSLREKSLSLLVEEREKDEL